MKGINIRITTMALLFSALIPCMLSGQDNAEMKTMRAGQLKTFGNSAWSQGDYSTAAVYLESYCEKKPKNYKTAFRLAECYRLSKDYQRAEESYLKAYQLHPSKNTLALFHYATMLKMNGNYKKSDEYYARFKKEYKGKDKSTWLKMIGNNTKAAEFVANSISHPLKVAISHLPDGINTSHVEAAPLFLNDSTVVYSSLKTDQQYFYLNPEDSTSTEPLRKFYLISRSDTAWMEQGEFTGPFNTLGVHVSNGVFSYDGKQFYFAECRRNKKNKVICALYVSSFEDGSWSEPQSLGNQVNLSGSSNTQPAIGTESQKNREVIYFISDRDGGKGGTDIWYTWYDSKKKSWSNPSNAGPKVNTAGDETTPFFDRSTRTLYFSSNGWPGMGGLDVFKTQGELKKWSTPENIGYPLNSSYDDLYFVLNPSDKETGMFVSNRETETLSGIKKGCCDDIFSFRLLDAVRLDVKGALVAESSKAGGPDAAMPIKGARITLEVKHEDDSAFVPAGSVYTSEAGSYSFPVSPNREYRMVTKKEGFLNNVYEFNTHGKVTSGSISVDLAIREAPLEAIPLQNIYYEYNKANLTEAAKTSIDTTLLLILKNNPDLVVEISSHTDFIGTDEANMTLSQARAESVVQYLIANGIDKRLLKAKGYGESRPTAPNQNPDGTDNPEGRQLNRRTEFRIIGKMRPDGSITEPGNF